MKKKHIFLVLFFGLSIVYFYTFFNYSSLVAKFAEAAYCSSSSTGNSCLYSVVSCGQGCPTWPDYGCHDYAEYTGTKYGGSCILEYSDPPGSCDASNFGCAPYCAPPTSLTTIGGCCGSEDACGGGVTPTPTPAPTSSGTDNSICASATGPTTVTTGQAMSWSYVFQNTGTSTWINFGTQPNGEPDNYRIDSPNDATWNAGWGWWGPNQPNTAPGQNLTTGNPGGTAPSTPGSYPWSWQLQRYKVATGWLNFGQACSATINVISPPPTLSVGLTATPSSGPPPLNSTLSATLGGTATGTINYSFWWNCSNTSNSVSTVSADPACGSLPAPAPGTCASNANGYKCNAVNTNPQTIAHSYNATSTAKVIVERSTASPAEARTPVTVTNSPPTASSVTATQPNYCASGPAATVSWTYSDPEGDPQSAYQVQINPAALIGTPPYVVDTGKVINSGTSYFTGGLSFNTTYKARVRVWDSKDAVSNWTESAPWTTPKHAYPLINFTWSPLSPPAGQPVQFTDLTTFYDAGVGHVWSWLFGDSGSSTVQNPSHTYAVTGSYNVTETATDVDGYACSLAKPIGIERPIPTWKEVNPK